MYQYYISERHDQIINIYKGTVKTEDVPAATQLFTTDWVVRYMVDNSLGKYWIERNPQSSLRGKLKYLAVPKSGAVPHIDEKIEPQSLTFFDPCMGSGHILIYAFEVLMDIYEECGYSARDAASEIVRHNLFGLDIDPRAYQLAYFSIMMKARQYDRRFFTREIEPQLYYPKHEHDLVQFGSLVQVTTLEGKPQEPKNLTLFNMNYEDDLNDWNFRRLLAQKYVVVCTNPPYLNKYNLQLKAYVIENYKDYSGDLFSVFIYRNLLLCRQDGYCCFMTPFVWMFIKTYEKLREFIIQNKSITTLIQMEYSAFEEATVPICSFVLQNKKADRSGLYFRLSDFKGGMEVQRQKVLEAIDNPNCGYFYEAQQSNFSKIPGSPVAYWVSDNLIRCYQNGIPLGQVAAPRKGNSTSDNNRFLRIWFEVDINTENFGCRELKRELTIEKRWFPYNKGGGYRKWYGYNEYMIDWYDDAAAIREIKTAVIANYQYFMKPGLTWSTVTSGGFSLRKFGYGFIFDNGGCCIFDLGSKTNYLLGLMNSTVFKYIFGSSNPTINSQSGEVAKFPVIFSLNTRIDDFVEQNVIGSKNDWDSHETSWDFKKHPLI